VLRDVHGVDATRCDESNAFTRALPDKCRILYLVGQLGRGGLERQLCYLLRAIDRQRYQPAVVVWRYAPDDVYVDEISRLGVRVYGFRAGVARATKLREFRLLTKRLEPEVIHSYSFHTNCAAQWAAFGTRAVPIGSLRGNFGLAKKASGIWLGCLSACWPRHQISNSTTCAEHAETSRSLFRPKEMHVVRNAVDLERFHSRDGTAVGKRAIVGIGSLLSVKRWDRVLRILRLIKRKRPDCQVQIAGDGPQRCTLEKQAQDLGVSDNIRFLGDTHDIPELIRSSCFLVHTSHSEGCPNSIIEAMACGRAVIAMDAGDIPLLVEDGQTGFIVSQGDEILFAQRVLQLLEDDHLCSSMGKAARTKAEREFNVERLVFETLASYRAAGWKG